MLVAFEEVEHPELPDPESKATGAVLTAARIRELERELQINRENHQGSIEELESSNEELKATNEELQSTNEELQSTNEELESSKEELQSLNEELQTVNAGLESNIEELSSARDDMRNLLNSTDVATIFVDNAVHVRRFTPGASVIVNLIQSDIGRPLEHVKSNLQDDGMVRDLEEVLKTLIPVQREVCTDDGHWFNMRVMPYRTIDNRIDGAVVTFSGVDDQKSTERRLNRVAQEAESAHQIMREVFDMSSDPLIIVDEDSVVVRANRSFRTLTQKADGEILRTYLDTVLPGATEKAALGRHLEAAFSRHEDFVALGVPLKLDDAVRIFNVRGRVIEGTAEIPNSLLLRFTSSDARPGT
jgi:two-component system CheB/CheR fusion protein